MSDYDSSRARHHGQAMDYSTGSGKGLWIGIGLVAVLAVIGLILGGGGGTGDGTATLPAEPAAIQPATEDAAPAADPVTAN